MEHGPLAKAKLASMLGLSAVQAERIVDAADEGELAAINQCDTPAAIAEAAAAVKQAQPKSKPTADELYRQELAKKKQGHGPSRPDIS